MATWNTDKPALTNTIAADIPDIEENFQEIKDAIEAFSNGTFGVTTAGNFKVDVLADGAACGTAPTMTSPVITTGVNDGTNAISFPTNGMAAAKFMLGNSNTITWFYLNTAPPGWKVLTTGADKILAVAGGAGAYNVNGGNTGGTSFDDLEAHTHTGPSHTHTGPSHTHTGPSHTHTGPSHNHQWYNYQAAGHGQSYDTNGSAVNVTWAAISNLYGIEADEDSDRVIGLDLYTTLAGTGNTGASGTGATSASGTGATGASGTANTGASSTTEARPTAAVGKLFQLDTA